MTIMRRHTTGRRVTGRAARYGVIAALVTSLPACEGLLDVDMPSAVPSESLDNPELAPILVLGVQGDFECALSSYVYVSGMFTDELLSATSLTIHEQADARTMTSSNTGGGCTSPTAGYTPFNIARFQSDDVVRRLQGFPDAAVPNKQRMIAQAAVYGGYALTLLGEGYCAGAIDGGPKLAPSGLWEAAKQRFDTAVSAAEAADHKPTLNLALVGRARALLNLGQMSAAAADARRVESGFEHLATYSATSSRRENTVFAHHLRSRNSSVDPRFRNLTVDGVADPRVVVRTTGIRGSDGVTPYWTSAKYTTVASSIRLASWREAQLIAALADPANAVEHINNVRSSRNLPLYTPVDPADAAAIQQQVLEERRRELFLEGHRLGDMRRHGLAFDQGANHKNTFTYGEDQTCMPVPNSEILGNPNFAG